MPKRMYTLSLASSFILYFYTILFVIWSGKKVRIGLKKHFTINEKIHFLPYQWPNIRRIGRYFKIFFVKSLSLWEITIIFGISASKYTENTRHHQKKLSDEIWPVPPQGVFLLGFCLGYRRVKFRRKFFLTLSSVFGVF